MIPKRSVRLLRAAEDDLNSIVTYVSAENKSAGLALADKFEESLVGLSSYPLMGRIPNHEQLLSLGYRYLVVENYLLFYTLEAHVILVHRIVHGARDYSTLL